VAWCTLVLKRIRKWLGERTAEHCIMTNFITCTVIKSRNMRCACSTHGRDEKCVQNFSRKNLKERDYLEGLGVDMKIILERILTEIG